MDRNMRSASVDARGECGDSLLRLALMELYAEEAESMEISSYADEMPVEKASRDHTFIQMRNVFRETFISCIPKAAGMVAAFIVISCTIMAGTLAVSRPAREYMAGLLLRIDGNAEQTMTDDAGSNDLHEKAVLSVGVEVPENWTGEYYLSYIPDGFEMLEVSDTASSHQVCYTNESGNVFSFEEYENMFRFLINTKNYDTELIEVNGTVMERIACSDGIIYTWSNGNKCLCLRCTEDNAEALEIAKSIVRLNIRYSLTFMPG